MQSFVFTSGGEGIFYLSANEISKEECYCLRGTKKGLATKLAQQGIEAWGTAK
jgi:hypothetical protein